MMRLRLAPALFLGMALVGCSSATNKTDAGGGTGGAAATGGSSGSGGSGTGGTGGASSTGGASGTGGAGSGGSGGSGGSLGGGANDASVGSGGDASTSSDGSAGGGAASPANWPGCGVPVMTGYTPAEFCLVYSKTCGFGAAMHWATLAECMTGFKGGSSDADGCKAGHLWRAATV